MEGFYPLQISGKWVSLDAGFFRPGFVCLTLARRRPMLCSLSKLEEKDLDEIRALEKDLGKTVLAFSCHKTDPAALDDDKLARLQALENRLGMSLVAVEA